ncbi:MAG: hypothetical protein OSA37_03325 [Flavobacteriales bacterium]|nr:hypothetical protein [Flavobacteriales bacterium]
MHRIFTLIVLTSLAGMVLESCQSGIPIAAWKDCKSPAMEVVECSIQDVLPGMESNLRRQRTYRVEAEMKSRHAIGLDWFLAVDSVLVPMRMQVLDKVTVRWVGSRSFYTNVRPGVPMLEQTLLEAHGQTLQGEAWLMGKSEDGCAIAVLPEWHVMPLIAAP